MSTQQEDAVTIVDRSAAKAAILARYRDETTRPPGMVAVRCTDHGRFIVWCSPPAPPCRVACPHTCVDRVGKPGPALHVTSSRPA